MAVIPLFLLGVVFFAARRYPLTRELHTRLVNVLKFKRGEQPETPAIKADEEELIRVLA